MDEPDHVEPQDPHRTNSQIVETAPMAAFGAGERFCYWNDKKYSAGATVCDSGRRYQCFVNSWVDAGPC